MHNTKDTQDERGMISIAVAIVFMTVISLTVVGFSQVTQRNSRQALDKQLSTQAYYAAEAGINDVMNKVAKMVDTGQVIPSQDTCLDSTKYTVNNGKLDSEGNEYTCLQVKADLDNLTYSHVGEGSVVVPLNATTGSLGLQELNWKPASPKKTTSDVANCLGAPAGGVLTNSLADEWATKCPYGLLRVDVIPTNTTTLSSAAEAQKANMTFFVYPNRGGSVPTINYESSAANVYGTGAPQGKVFNAQCDATECKANLDLSLAGSTAFMRVSSLYVPTPTFQVVKDSGTFSRSQIQVDVTGKSQDVLRRVQVRLSVTGSSSRTSHSDFSDFPIQSTSSLCKRYVAAPNYGTSDAAYTCPD